jgi:copper chaperone
MAKTIDLTITGMTCDHCVHAVTTAIGESEGVESVEVSLERGAARFEGEGFDLDTILAAIEEEGYHAEVAAR